MVRPNYSVLDIVDSIRPVLGLAKKIEISAWSSAESEGSVHHYKEYQNDKRVDVKFGWQQWI